MGLMRRLKDTAIGSAAKMWLNSRYLQGVGRITTLDIDTTNRHIDAEIELRGEDSPIRARLGYVLVKGGTQTTVSLSSFDSSRAWLSEAVGRFVIGPGKTFPLPKPLADAMGRAGM